MDDDLTLLRELRADAPSPDAERLRSLRARVLEPRGRASRGRASRGRALRGRAARPGRWRPGFWLAPSALAVTTAVAAVLVVVTAGGDRVPGVVTAERTTQIDTPRAVLLRAALMAERRQAGGTPRDDQWMYRMVTVQQPGDARRTVQEYWTRYDGTEQAFREDEGPMERHRIEPDPDDDDLTPKQYAARLAALPTEPGKLLAHVRADRHWQTRPAEKGEERLDALAFRVLSVYLEQEAPVPPELEAAIFRALAEIPGIRVDQGVPDAVGRHGVGLSYDLAAQRDAGGRLVSRSYVVLDPTTFEFLGRRVENLQDDVLGGEVLARKGTYYATAELASGVVDRPGVTP